MASFCMTPMTQTNHAIHLSRLHGVSSPILSSLRPGDGKRKEQAVEMINIKQGVCMPALRQSALAIGAPTLLI